LIRFLYNHRFDHVFSYRNNPAAKLSIVDHEQAPYDDSNYCIIVNNVFHEICELNKEDRATIGAGWILKRWIKFQITVKTIHFGRV
jgi:hypothetical protein